MEHYLAVMENTYCAMMPDLPEDHVHRQYHDYEYGFTITDDNELFGRLILEINQAGLSWLTILNKQENFRSAYAGYDIETVARFTEVDRQRLLANAGIIRNKLKVNAAIHNANVILSLQEKHGSFKTWIDHHHPLTRDEWVKLFKKTFKFTGGEITNEFLMSTGYLPGAHDSECPTYRRVLEENPVWLAEK